MERLVTCEGCEHYFEAFAVQRKNKVLRFEDDIDFPGVGARDHRGFGCHLFVGSEPFE